MQLMKEFMDFLKEYKVIALAIAFIMGAAATDLIQSLVKNIIMPMIKPVLSGGDWQTAQLVAGPFSFGIGPFLGSLINFVIIAFVVFLMAKMVLGQDKVGKI